MTKETINQINVLLTQHSSFKEKYPELNVRSNKSYLEGVDELALIYEGSSTSLKVCALLTKYFESTKVCSLSEAIDNVAYLVESGTIFETKISEI